MAFGPVRSLAARKCCPEERAEFKTERSKVRSARGRSGDLVKALKERGRIVMLVEKRVALGIQQIGCVLVFMAVAVRGQAPSFQTGFEATGDPSGISWPAMSGMTPNLPPTILSTPGAPPVTLEVLGWSRVGGTAVWPAFGSRMLRPNFGIGNVPAELLVPHPDEQRPWAHDRWRSPGSPRERIVRRPRK